jgi:hypothetical protein
VITAQAEPIDPHQSIGEWLSSCAHDPIKFVAEGFPWGEGELKNFPDGMMEWQRWVLEQISEGLCTPGKPVKIAIASGHGIGKSAICALIVLWAMTTSPDYRGIVTASTEMMLTTRLRAELRKWFRLFRAAAFFELTASALLPIDGNRDTWRFDLQPWNSNRPESFAGLHNAGRRILVIQDEASAIDKVIWDTIQPVSTDREAEVIWLACGNPLHPEGRFKDCFAEGTDWITRHIDSRLVPITNKQEFQRWIAAYGEDSDFCLSRIRGIFPRQAFNRFISPDVVDAAMQRPAEANSDPLVLGCDVARFGDDMSVLFLRKGLDASTYPVMKFRNLPLDQLEDKIVELCVVHRIEMVFVDGTGLGGGLVDHLQRRRLNVRDVQFGSKADQRRERYANKRAEIWGILREKLPYLSLPRDPELKEQLCGPEFSLNSRDEILLEPKDSMKRRGVASPDVADALAVTFAVEHATMPVRAWESGRGDHLVQSWHDPFSPEYMNDAPAGRLQAPRFYAQGWAKLRDDDAA